MPDYVPNPYEAGESQPEPKETPAALNPNPAVKTFQRIYVLLMLLLYTALFAGSVAAAFYRDTLSVELDTPPGELAVLLLCYGVLAAALAIIFLIGLFWNRGMGGWIYNLILICLGLTSCCTWPMTIPLLIFWIKHKHDIEDG